MEDETGTYAWLMHSLQIYIGHSEKDAQDFAALTFDVKKPIEVAAEAADKPKDVPAAADLPAGDFSIPAFLADPVNYSRGKVIAFVQDATKDPLGTLKANPQTGAVVGGLAATLIGMLGLLLGLLAPKPAVVKQQAKKAQIKVSEKAADVKDAAVATASDVGKAAEGAGAEIKKRTAAAKGKAAE